MDDQQFAFEADTGKILDIVINSLYSQKEIFLRELISNASDAVDKRKFAVLGAGDASETFDGEITITADRKAGTLTITDNGIGLSAEEMPETLGTIASSGTKAFVESLGEAKEGEELTDQLIGQFGVGFYSAFMVADRIEVVSRRHGAAGAHDGTVTASRAMPLPPASVMMSGPASSCIFARRPRNSARRTHRVSGPKIFRSCRTASHVARRGRGPGTSEQRGRIMDPASTRHQRG